MEPIPESQLLAVRRAKLDALRACDTCPFGGKFEVAGTVGDVRSAFADGETTRMAGRVTAHRNMGKSHFLDLSDFTGRMQVFVGMKEISEEDSRTFAEVDIGDWIGVEGTYFTTKTGEPTAVPDEIPAAPARKMARRPGPRNHLPSTLP